MKQITKNNILYEFIELGENAPYEFVISWLETNNPIYINLPLCLLNKDYTGIIKVFDNNNIKLEIKIYEGYYIKIIDHLDKIIYFIENNKISLEIREYLNYNKTDVRYIYDTYIITHNTDSTIDVFYRDTMKRGDFNLKNVKFQHLSDHQKNIFNKFNNIIKETIQQINYNVNFTY